MPHVRRAARREKLTALVSLFLPATDPQLRQDRAGDVGHLFDRLP